MEAITNQNGYFLHQHQHQHHQPPHLKRSLALAVRVLKVATSLLKVLCLLLATLQLRKYKIEINLK